MLKQVTAKALNSASAFATDREGSIAMIAAVLTPMMLMIAGLSINVAHLYNVKAGMTQTLDSALASTTRDVIVNGRSDSAAKAAMDRFITANGSAGLSEADKLTLGDLDIDRSKRTISAQLTSNVKMPFPVFGVADTWPVTVAATTSYTERPVEVAMMLDITGSMSWDGTRKKGRKQTKLQNLQDAASDAVRDLLARNRPGQQPRVRVALVPYSQGVNTGVLSEANYIEDKDIPVEPLGLDILNNPRSLLEQTIKFKQDVLHKLKDMDKCTTERRTKDGDIDFSDAPPSESTVNRALSFQKAVKEAANNGWASPCPTAEVVPLTANQTTLLRAISNFRAAGGTAGHIGVQWTRYVLSPKWGSFLRAKVNAQAVPATPSSSPTSVRKVAILLTDGEFNAQYVDGADSASAARTHCAALKDGVEVFTIGFMLNNRDAKATMAACASPDKAGGVKHYYEASNAEELKAAFDAISANTEVVRLTN